MRHRVHKKALNRTPSHRLAMRRNLVQSLIEHGQVRTTLVKAKDVRALAEKLVGLGIDGSLAARQRAIALINDRSFIAKENKDDYDGMSDAKRDKVLRSRSGRRYRASTTRPGVKFTAASIIHKLFTDIGPQMRARNEKRGCGGGYTRVIKLADRRLGDASPLAILQFVGADDAPRPQATDKTERKRRARVKYAFYAGKPLKRRGQKRGSRSPKKVEASAKDAATAGGDEASASE